MKKKLYCKVERKCPKIFFTGRDFPQKIFQKMSAEKQGIKSIFKSNNSSDVNFGMNTIFSVYSIKQAVILTAIGLYSVAAQAAILSENSERRVQIRQPQGTGYIVKTPPAVNNNVSIRQSSRHGNESSGDSMQNLIQQKEREFDFGSFDSGAKVSITESKRVNTNPLPPVYSTIYNTTYEPVYSTNSNAVFDNNMGFNSWLNSDRYRAQQVSSYQRYLSAQLGANNVPPMSQLLTTARSWDKCGYEPYQLPPQELWSNIVPTLRLYSNLKQQGVLPRSTEIRSVYRSPALNQCAGGAAGSKHMTAGAIDIWVPEYETSSWRLNNMQDGLCQFWQYQGENYGFGLGLYATGAIHLDTQGYRKWGFNHASSGSSCRL